MLPDGKLSLTHHLRAFILPRCLHWPLCVSKQLFSGKVYLPAFIARMRCCHN